MMKIQNEEDLIIIARELVIIGRNKNFEISKNDALKIAVRIYSIQQHNDYRLEKLNNNKK